MILKINILDILTTIYCIGLFILSATVVLKSIFGYNLACYVTRLITVISLEILSVFAIVFRSQANKSYLLYIVLFFVWLLTSIWTGITIAKNICYEFVEKDEKDEKN